MDGQIQSANFQLVFQTERIAQTCVQCVHNIHFRCCVVLISNSFIFSRNHTSVHTKMDGYGEAPHTLNTPKTIHFDTAIDQAE